MHWFIAQNSASVAWESDPGPSIAGGELGALGDGVVTVTVLVLVTYTF
jgi:hypothetical protein